MEISNPTRARVLPTGEIAVKPFFCKFVVRFQSED